MKTIDATKLRRPSRDDLVRAISHAMLYQGRKRSHHWDSMNARVAAETLIDNLEGGNYVIMQGPPAVGAAQGHAAEDKARRAAQGGDGGDSGT